MCERRGRSLRSSILPNHFGSDDALAEPSLFLSLVSAFRVAYTWRWPRHEPSCRPRSAAYSENLRALVCSLADWTDPAVLPVTPDADEAILELERAIEPRMDASRNGDLAHIADWANKHTGATIRIAALIHLGTHLRDGWGRPIDADTIAAAARVGDYYLQHALAAFDLMGADPTVEDAKVLLGWIQRHGRPTFTRRDAFDQNRARFGKATNTDPALAVLEEHGYLRREDPEPGRRGRPSVTYHVNPHAITAEPAKT